MKSPDRNYQVIQAYLRFPSVLDEHLAIGAGGKNLPGITHVDPLCTSLKPLGPIWVGTANEQRSIEAPLHQLEPLQAIAKRMLMEEQLGTDPSRAIASQ